METNSNLTANRHLPCVLGSTKHSDMFITDLSAEGNLLVVCPDVDKKTRYLAVLINSIASFQSPHDVDFLYCGNNPAFRQIQPELGLRDDYVSGDEGQISVTAAMIISTFNKMSERYEGLKQRRCKNIIDYNSTIASDKTVDKMCYEVILIDEIKTIFTEMDKDVVDMLVKIATYGRCCGIHIISATSYTTPDVLNGYVKTSLAQGRIVFKVPSSVDSYVCFDRQGAESLSEEEALYSDSSDEWSVFYRISPFSFEL